MPTTSIRSTRKYRFGEFELDSRAGVLRRSGEIVRLQEQPLRLLTLLLERPGEVALRADIQRRLWPNDTVVEIGHGINAAVQRLREALGESAESPRYIETVARRGYRFCGEAAPHPIGSSVGHFRVIEKLGGGGMGLVYRAEDLRLGREVALKLLPPELAGDRTAIGRFDREARAASALNHPHICTIYGVEQHEGQPAIVMELVAGPTLEAVLREGPLPPDRALAYALQIAGALEAAHRKGVVHRDLKPGNIVIGESGVKVLDFGLAKTEHGRTVTRDGAIVGTPDYMSPEQVRGEEVDGRSDLYSFGVVLHEMLTGRRPGAEAAVGSPLGRVANRCLRPRPEDRWQSAPELIQALEVCRVTATSPVRWGRRAWLGLATVPAAALVVWKSAAPKRARFELRFPGGEMQRLSLSPDGRGLAFIANGRLYVREVEGTAVQPIDGVQGVGTPFWSADGRRLAIATGGRLRVVEVATGTVRTIAAVNTNVSGAWAPDGSILIGLVGDGLYRVAEGALTRVTALDPGRDEARHLLPQFLPTRQRYLFTAGSAKPGASMAWVGSMGVAERTPIGPVGSGLAFVGNGRGAKGWLLYGKQRSLLAQPYDAATLSATGTEFVVAQGVVSRPAIGAAVDLMEFTAAGDTLAYRPIGSDATVVVRGWMG